jgi:hypothetical protein
MKIFITLFIYLIFSQLDAQNSATAYNFKSGKSFKPSITDGMYTTSTDFLSGAPEKVDKIEVQYDGLLIKRGKEKEKKKFGELAEEYWGFIWFGISTCRFYKYENSDNWGHVALQCMGNICLYSGISLSEPNKNTDGVYTYKYSYVKESGIEISNGLDGEIFNLTNKNFSNILSEINPALGSEYLNEFNSLTGVKLEKEVSQKKETMDLFIKYFEMANNL